MGFLYSHFLAIIFHPHGSEMEQNGRGPDLSWHLNFHFQWQDSDWLLILRQFQFAYEGDVTGRENSKLQLKREIAIKSWLLLYLHGGPLDRGGPLVFNESLDSPVSLPKELEEGAPVVVPELRQLGGRRVLAARQLQGDLHAPVPDVVVVLHASRQRVPRRAVRRPVSELWRANLFQTKDNRKKPSFLL